MANTCLVVVVDIGDVKDMHYDKKYIQIALDVVDSRLVVVDVIVAEYVVVVVAAVVVVVVVAVVVFEDQ